MGVSYREHASSTPNLYLVHTPRPGCCFVVVTVLSVCWDECRRVLRPVQVVKQKFDHIRNGVVTKFPLRILLFNVVSLLLLLMVLLLYVSSELLRRLLGLLLLTLLLLFPNK